MGEDVSCFFCSLGPLALQQRLRYKTLYKNAKRHQKTYVSFFYISISTEYTHIYIYIDLCLCDLPSCNNVAMNYTMILVYICLF